MTIGAIGVSCQIAIILLFLRLGEPLRAQKKQPIGLLFLWLASGYSRFAVAHTCAPALRALGTARKRAAATIPLAGASRLKFIFWNENRKKYVQIFCSCVVVALLIHEELFICVSVDLSTSTE
jgi:hypothetical protein